MMWNIVIVSVNLCCAPAPFGIVVEIATFRAQAVVPTEGERENALVTISSLCATTFGYANCKRRRKHLL